MGLWIPGGLSDSGGGSYVPCEWGTGTDDEIVEALEKHYAGEIDLTEYWAVGDERTISLSQIPRDSGGVAYYVQPAQNIVMVILNTGGKELTTPINNISECAFVVGQKNSLYYADRMETADYSNGGWDSCGIRTWYNTNYRNAFPSTIINIFKEFKNITAGSSTASNNNTPIISNDYFAPAAEKEVFGTNSKASSTAESNLSQFKYYETTTNRQKVLNGSNNRWWLRSPRYNYTNFCNVETAGTVGTWSPSGSIGVSPFGVI